MAWIRYESGFTKHPKVQTIPPAIRPQAIALHHAGCGYSAELLTDGLVPDDVWPALASQVGILSRSSSRVTPLEKTLAALKTAGLIDRRKGAWEVHDYLDYNPSRARVLEQRKMAADRQNKRRTGDVTRDKPRDKPRDTAPPVTHSVTRDKPRDSRARARPGPKPLKNTPTNPPSHSEGGNGKRPRRLTARELRRYTGCRAVRGTHGTGHIYDPLGTDTPPKDWTHGYPSRDEVEAALSANALPGEPD